MLVRPVTRTNFLGKKDVIYKRIEVNEKTDKSIRALARAYGLNFSFTRDKDVFNPENSKVTVYASKKITKKLDGKGGWKSAIHSINDYEVIDVPNSQSLDEVSQRLKMSVIDRVFVLGEKVKEHTGHSIDFFKRVKK